MEINLKANLLSAKLEKQLSRFLQPTYTATDNELLRKKKRKSR